MSKTMQIILCGAPYIFTLVALIVWVQPAIESANHVKYELTMLTDEYDRLARKLKEKEVLIEQKRKLDRDIQRMRASVPPAPEIDILLIDMERLSNESGTELLSVEPPSETKTDKSENIMDSIIAEVGGRLAIPKPPEKEKPKVAKPNPTPSINKVIEEALPDPLGIKHIDRRVYVSGNYRQLSDFLKRLEAYQRIVAIRGLIVAAPDNAEKDMVKTPASEKARSLGLDTPVMTFVMSVYYLP
ncbi:MAG: hypothetical protein K2X93_09930 [Candidatus Obscuribacterales bacterium]|nr:hypothetical protein [Candidatus Obscuribacterales bacterium]